MEREKIKAEIRSRRSEVRLYPFLIRNPQPRRGIAETEGKAAMGSGERERAASKFQSTIRN
jgi:hypothetical protein